MQTSDFGNYRALTEQEIDKLQQQGCHAENWQLIRVVSNFKTDHIRNVYFISKNYLGLFNKKITTKDGIEKPCGIFNATLSNCNIKDNVYINNVNQYLSNYIVSENVIIDNINSMVTTTGAMFGNGVEVGVLNEAGGREVKIFNELSAPTAYLIVSYRHRNKFVEKMHSLIDEYSNRIKSDTGIVAQDVIIQNCGIIRNVNIGPFSTLDGVSLLENGSIVSNAEDPVHVGTGVIAKNFIITAGTIVDEASILSDCFVGQGCRIGKQFSAENSLFFANCEGFHGEVISVFAGPYTVSHHKSTLLIAAMYSFYNAGSGSNESNHMYRLGPVHQGILERGCKTGSFSYLIWPTRVGAFTSIIGKHSSKFDTSELPFSYISEKNCKSKITPGMNFFNVGTTRDGTKWPLRDRRKSSNKLDLIIFDVLTPYTVQKVINGLAILTKLVKDSPAAQQIITYKGVAINRSNIDIYHKNYEMIIKKYLGEKIIQRLSENDFESSFKNYEITSKKGKWIDIAGLIAPQEVINKLIEDVEHNAVKSIEAFNQRLREIYQLYSNYEWQWVLSTLGERLGKKATDITSADINNIIAEWKKINEKFTELVLKDAEKEFDENAQVGYGLDGDEAIRIKDFKAVRGNYDTNSFVQQMKTELKNKNEMADKVLQSLF